MYLLNLGVKGVMFVPCQIITRDEWPGLESDTKTVKNQPLYLEFLEYKIPFIPCPLHNSTLSCYFSIFITSQTRISTYDQPPVHKEGRL